MPQSIPTGLTKDHILRAVTDIEADAIIVTDVPDPETTPYFSTSDFYVGCSRAKHMLVILATEKGVL